MASSECKTDQVTGVSASKNKLQSSAAVISTGTSSPVSACQMNIAMTFAHQEKCWTPFKLVVKPNALEYKKSMKATILNGLFRWTSKLPRHKANSEEMNSCRTDSESARLHILVKLASIGMSCLASAIPSHFAKCYAPEKMKIFIL